MGLLSSIGDFFQGVIGDIIGFLVGADFDEIEDQAKGTLVNKQSNIDPIPVVYGKRRVGGVRVFVSTGGSKKNEYLHIALVLCEGTIQAIDEIYVNDKPHTHSDYSGLIDVQKKLGGDNQQYATILSGADDTWGSNHRLRGVAYLAIRIKYDADVFGGIPEIQCVIRGKKVYDPRTGSTAYSTNPALCLRDYLTNSRYGKGLPSSAINDTMFGAAATYYDNTTVSPYSGGSNINLIDCNARLDTGKTIFNNVKELLQGMRGLLPYTEGQYGLIVDQATSSTFSLTPDNITSDITVQNSGKGKRFNRVIAKFPNPETNWQNDSVTFPASGSSDETTFLSEDNGEELIKNLNLNTITSIYQARDIARIVCLASRKNVNAVSLRATSEALNIAVGDVVSLEHPSLGWTGASVQTMRVIATQLLNTGEVNLSLLEYNGSIYPFAQGAEANDSPVTNLPDPFDIASPATPLTPTEAVIIGPDGTYQSAVTLTWGEADDAFVNEYEVQWKKSTDSVYVNFAYTSELEIDIFNLQVNQDSAITYNFRVRAINTLGVKSAFITANLALTGDDTAPGTPDGLGTTGGIQTITAEWSNPTDLDLKHIEVFVSDQDSIPASPTALVDGEEYIVTGLSGAETRYFWLKAVDFSNNKSSATASFSGTSVLAGSDDIGSGAINDLATFASNIRPVQIVSSLPATATQGDMAFLTTDNNLYRYDGAQWTRAIALADVTGAGSLAGLDEIQLSDVTDAGTLAALDSIQLSDVTDAGTLAALDTITSSSVTDLGSLAVLDDIDLSLVTDSGALAGVDIVTTDLIAANTIVAGNIASATITTAEIAANTIVAGNIASATITSAEIVSNTIVAGDIASQTITSSEIAANTIVAANIASGTITSAEILSNTITAGQIAAGAIGATEISVSELSAISSNLGTLTAGTIDATDVDITNLTVNNLAGDVTTVDTFTASNVPFQVQSTYTRSMVSIASQSHAYRPFVTINATAQLQDNITVWGELQMRENNTSGKTSIGTVTASSAGFDEDYLFLDGSIVLPTTSSVSVGDLVGLTSNTSASYRVTSIVELSTYLLVYVRTTTGGIVLSAPPTGAYSKFAQTAAWVTVSKSYVVERSGPSWKPMSFQGALSDSTTNSVDVQVVFYRSGTVTNSTATPPTTTSGSKKFGIINIQGTVMLAR